VVGRCKRAIRAARRAAGHAQPLKRLRAGHLVHQVAIDVQQADAVRRLVHHVVSPDFVKQRARFGCCCRRNDGGGTSSGRPTHRRGARALHAATARVAGCGAERAGGDSRAQRTAGGTAGGTRHAGRSAAHAQRAATDGARHRETVHRRRERESAKDANKKTHTAGTHGQGERSSSSWQHVRITVRGFLMLPPGLCAPERGE